LWITEYAWNYPNTFKKFSGNTNMTLAPRCAKDGFPGSTIKVSNTSYDIYTDCNAFTSHNLKQGINKVWGPYQVSFGGSLPSKMATLVVSNRYNCDSNYANCGDKEEYYLGKRYGLVQWVTTAWLMDHISSSKRVSSISWQAALPLRSFSAFSEKK
jgi:hypothetical protein